jgi:mRNA-degrading endonuclease toxin of MazEF toxin-antitoxin module
MEKNFNNWNLLKQKLDQRKTLPSFEEKEIWWCHLGLNVGDEENGKGDSYHRPVLIIKKFNNRLFSAVPLTTQIKEKHYYRKIVFKEREQCVILSQFRVLDSKRLDRKMGKLSKKQYKEIREILSRNMT